MSVDLLTGNNPINRVRMKTVNYQECELAVALKIRMLERSIFNWSRKKQILLKVLKSCDYSQVSRSKKFTVLGGQ